MITANPKYDPRSPASVEKYSSAVTLSDMEVFIFPELMYALVLANVMSGRLWAWRGDPWFAKSAAQSEMKRVQRLKQYIMDRFSFNLDLDTWGLTSKEREIARFSAFISEEILARSNALFGYEGDKYYFDIDIRRHFGLDKYTSNIIPYWKTETVEAMEAFRFKEGYAGGAGECVSFAALYAAAAFAAADIPLDKIFLLATPLHSQNFLDVGEGILTNNRRIVTKNMWYNGTELSAKARRALENETVTIVAHNTGCIHTVFPDATIDRTRYGQLKNKLAKFLSTDITYEILANFLRHNSGLQKHFQISFNRHGKTLYIEAEKVYSYEHSSKLRVGDNTQENLLQEIEDDEYYTDPCPHRFDLGKLQAFLGGNKISIDNTDGIDKLKNQLADGPIGGSHIVSEMIKFCNTQPMMPHEQKIWAGPGTGPPITLDGVTCAQEAREALKGQRGNNETVNLAFMAFRDLSSSPWKPFLKAAVERNPVCAIGCDGLTVGDAYKYLSSPAFADASIYGEEYRLAQPDEVWNYRRGDGLEKAVTLASVYVDKKIRDACGDSGQEIIRKDSNFSGNAADNVAIDISGKRVKLVCGKEEFLFETGKRLPPPKRDDWFCGLLLLLLSLSALLCPARPADDTLFRVYSRAAPQSVVSRSFAGAGSAVPHDVFQGLTNPALTAAAGDGAKSAYEAGYGRGEPFDKLALPVGALLLETNGAMGAYYRYLSGKRGYAHEAVVNFAGRLFDQADPQGNGPVDFGMNFRYENSKWRHDTPLPPTDADAAEPESAANTIETRGNSLLLDIGFYQRYLPGFDFSLVFSNLTGYRWSKADGRGKSQGWIDGRHRLITVGMLYSLPIAGAVLLRVPVDVEAANVFAKSRPAAYMLRAGTEILIAQAYSVRFGYARAPQDPAELITKFDYDNLFFGGVGVAVKGVLLDIFAGKRELGASATYRR